MTKVKVSLKVEDDRSDHEGKKRKTSFFLEIKSEMKKRESQSLYPYHYQSYIMRRVEVQVVLLREPEQDLKEEPSRQVKRVSLPQKKEVEETLTSQNFQLEKQPLSSMFSLKFRLRQETRIKRN
jgi:hypothetical protein